MSRFQTLDAGKVGQGAEEVAVAWGEAVAVGLIEARSDTDGVGWAVDFAVAVAVAVARGEPVGVGPALAIGVLAAVGAGVSVVAPVACTPAAVGDVPTEAEASRSDPFDPARATPVAPGLPVGVPARGAHWTKAMTRTPASRAADRIGRAGVRMGEMLSVRLRHRRPKNVPGGHAFRT